MVWNEPSAKDQTTGWGSGAGWGGIQSANDPFQVDKPQDSEMPIASDQTSGWSSGETWGGSHVDVAADSSDKPGGLTATNKRKRSPEAEEVQVIENPSPARSDATLVAGDSPAVPQSRQEKRAQWRLEVAK